MTSQLKSWFRLIATIFVLPIYASYRVQSCWMPKNAALESHSQWLSVIPGFFGNYLRNAFYRLTLVHCDPEATICFGVLISRTETRIGKHAYIGPRCMIGWATIEDDVLVGPSVQILSGPNVHTFDSIDHPIRNQPRHPQHITIGRDSWIGANSVVLASVASQSVIGANSTVVKPTTSRSIAVGSPAKTIAKRGTATC